MRGKENKIMKINTRTRVHAEGNIYLLKETKIN